LLGISTGEDDDDGLVLRETPEGAVKVINRAKDINMLNAYLKTIKYLHGNPDVKKATIIKRKQLENDK